MEEPMYEPTEEEVQDAWTDSIKELYANGTFREVPCRDCGEVTFFPNPEDEFCSECWGEHYWMRAITLAGDRWCPHCNLIGISDEAKTCGVWRDEPTCLSCGKPERFPELDDGILAHLCFRCEAKKTFEYDIYCSVCDTVDIEHLRTITAFVQREWDTVRNAQ